MSNPWAWQLKMLAHIQANYDRAVIAHLDFDIEDEESAR